MAEPVKGRIHSYETCGMVDGPGLRFVLFLQGCPLRCLYCHNPDSWSARGGREMNSQEVVNEVLKYRSWMEASGGGLTLSGGEALFQPDFARDILIRCARKGIHTVLDTAGYGKLERIAPVLDAADLVILDIKSVNEEVHKKVTGVSGAVPLETLNYLQETGKPLWIRHVVVPGLTDDRRDLAALKGMLLGLKNLERVELLPFHKMGEEKWLPGRYTLENTPIPEADFMKALCSEFREAGLPAA